MNAIVSALRLDALRTGWRRWAVIGVLTSIAAIAIFKLYVFVVPPDENRAAGDEIIAALEAYKVGYKRYPDRLAQLQPKYLNRIPQPAPGTNFVYADSSDGSTAWFGYQTLSEFFYEYDTRTRKWEAIGYDQSEALRKQTKEFVMGPK